MIPDFWASMSGITASIQWQTPKTLASKVHCTDSALNSLALIMSPTPALSTA
jgi:hypothetical protein